MKFSKILALLLSVFMITALFSGCMSNYHTDPESEASSAAALDLAGADASVDPTTVMLTVDGKNVTWDKFFYYIVTTINEIQSYGAEITDWSAVYQDETTYAEYVLDRAVMIALQAAAIEYGAEQLNVTISDQDKTDIQADWDADVASAGSEEAFLAQLQGVYSTKEIYLQMDTIRYLASGCFKALYGENGANLSDQDVADYTAEDGFLMAKHILMLTSVTDDTGTSTAMTDTEKSAVRAKMEEILSQLKGYSGDDFDAYFDTLMNQHSEDTGGLALLPDGYLFQSGDMVSQFEEGTTALEIGEISDIIETDYGYHIIYRIPINCDVTPMVYAQSGAYSLRLITALNMFNAVVDTWLNSLDVTYSDAYKALDFEKMFAVG